MMTILKKFCTFKCTYLCVYRRYRNMEINMKNYELLGVVDMNGMNRLRRQKIGGGKQKSSTHV